VAFDWYIGARESENRWSPELEAMYGLEPGTFDGTYEGWKKLVHPDDWPAVKDAIKRAHESGDVAAEYRVIHRDGSVHWLQAKGRMFFDAEGRAERMIGFMIDVTDRRHAEEELRASEAALRESEQRYRTLFEKANDAIFLENEGDEIIEVNERACTLLGYSRDELLRMKVPNLQAPEIRGQAGRVLREEMDKHGSATFESVDLHRSGRRIPIEVTNTRISDRGENLVLSVVRDITERKRAEEELRATETRFRTLVEFAADAFMLHAGDATVIDVNRQACENLGYSREELIGMKPADFDADLDPEALQNVSRRIGAGDIVTIETHHRRKDGTVFPVELRLRQVRQGGRRFTISLARDITERKRVEEERERLRRLEAELARVSRLTTLGELTTSIAHEVSQPLGAMVASAGACARWLAADPPAMAEARAALDNIVADGKRAREVIARIRALTKRQVPRKDELDIDHQIREVVALTEHELRTHNIVLRTELDETLPRAAGDRVQLQQVLLNLIVNAIEAMSAVHDRARELTIVSQEDGPNAVAVEVRDSGTGLDPQAAERVFEAFYTTKAEGLGIGLSISRSIIEAHGGRLSASANEPHGAVFRLSLPVAADGQS
jgi:PAS domain S-box-containing protein